VARGTRSRPDASTASPGRYLPGYAIFAECPALAPGAAVFAFAVGISSMDVPGGVGGGRRRATAVRSDWRPAPPP
jgi:hypothetical protein